MEYIAHFDRIGVNALMRFDLDVNVKTKDIPMFTIRDGVKITCFLE